ncbi:MAG: FliM/FliN family flagellar motor switch protein [Moraxellaceae bacterium]|nr:FliM/FliN family flagellar motor switch protein [Moraxellaceae bacterium]MDZ4385675.1 FliM/FliN family flagellar motor switch protein [Moraxellaceae bacterium]
MSVTVEHIELNEATPELVKEGGVLIKRDIGLVKHVLVELSVEVGTVEMSIDELFELKSGGLVKLQQQVNEPATLRLDGKAVARGNLVAVDDNFGVQLTEIL